nr:putative ribonuclease H-like domain-containing protein [Tanacetum cinerariifolium]
MDHKVKTIRCYNETEFKNRIMNQFCEMKGIRREFSVARTPQQNGREIAQRNEFESTFGQDKYVNGNRMFTPYSATGSTYVNLGGSILVNAATLPTDTLMPDLVVTADLLDTRIFSGTYDDKVEGAVADFNNSYLTIVVNPSWIEAMQDELLQFRLQKVWRLVDLPQRQECHWNKINKKDKRGIIVRNKARLVVQCYTQEEGIDYDEVFAHVARIEAIRVFLACASFMGFIVYQIDMKSAFLYGTIEEEVYVFHPPGFEDPHYPDKVYKVEKALYGLHQAPRARYETLSTYLLENRFRNGIIDKTLFIKKDKGDLLLVQVCVDDIIFGSTKKSLCTEFEGLIHKKF